MGNLEHTGSKQKVSLKFKCIIISDQNAEDTIEAITYRYVEHYDIVHYDRLIKHYKHNSNLGSKPGMFLSQRVPVGFRGNGGTLSTDCDTTFHVLPQ